MRVFVSTAAVALYLTLVAPLHGNVLGAYTVTNANSDSAGDLHYVILPIKVVLPGYTADFTSPGYFLFKSEQWTEADVGTTRTETVSTSSDAASAIGLLTDGLNEFILMQSWMERFNGGNQTEKSTSEAAAFFPGGGGPDFAGYTITGVSETLNSISISTLPNGPSSSNSNYTVTIEGEPVPEPTSAVILLAPAMVALLVRRKAHSKVSPQN